MKVILSALFGALTMGAVAAGEQTFDFNDQGNDRRVKLNGNFEILEGVGRNGSRAVRWMSGSPKKTPDSMLVTVPVEPGRQYGYELWVKSEGVTNGVATAHFICLDAGGKTISTVEGRPHIRREVGRKGWQRVTCPSGRMPGNAAFAQLQLGVRAGVTGTLYFDDVRMTEGDRRYVEFIHTSTYRDLAVSGKVRFVAPYILDEKVCAAGDLRPEFAFVGADGKSLVLRPDKVESDFFEIEVDVARLAMGTHPVRAILKTAAGRELDAAEIAFTRATEFPKRKVAFDAHNRLVVDGKPFFPIGMYAGKIANLDIAAYRTAAFNCLLGSMTREGLDKVAANGLKAIVGMPTDPVAMRPRLAAVKDHPAVLAWYNGDEVPPGFLSRQVELQRAFRQDDPEHPTFAVLDKPHHVRLFLPTFDVIGMDPYPIGNHRGGIDIASGWVREGKAGAFGMRPIWHVPQCFDWGWFRPGPRHPEYRFPTADEFRSMAWQPIAAGANGLIWYSYAVMVENFGKEDFACHWSYVKETVDSVAKYAPMMLSVETPISVKGGSADVPVRVWRHGGENWILAANSRREGRKASLAVDGAVGDIKVELGACQPRVEGSVIELNLQPLEVSLIRFR